MKYSILLLAGLSMTAQGLNGSLKQGLDSINKRSLAQAQAAVDVEADAECWPCQWCNPNNLIAIPQDLGDIAIDCDCDLDTTPPLTVPSGSPQVVGYVTSGAVSSGTVQGQIPNTADRTECIEQCCACTEEVESSASASWEHHNYKVEGGINVNEMLFYCTYGNATEQSIGENHFVETCDISNTGGASGSPAPDCFQVCQDGTSEGGSGSMMIITSE